MSCAGRLPTTADRCPAPARHPGSGRATRQAAALVVAMAVVLAACGSSGGRSVATTTTGTPIAPPAPPTVWLCRPGQAGDPCTENLDVTTVAADGATTVHAYKPAVNPPFDCFYAFWAATSPLRRALYSVGPSSTSPPAGRRRRSDA